MKNIIFLLISSLMYFSSYAQDPQLFENNWYLHKIIINGVDFFPPGTNGEASTINLYINENNISSTVCDTRGADITEFDDVNNNFTVGIFVSLADDCIYNENQIFQDLYFDDFFRWIELTNTYQYQIEIGSDDSRTLTLTNSDGNQAIYGDEILGLRSFNNLSFSIFPNPANETLVLNATNKIDNLNIQIFTTEGKLLTTQNLDFNHQVSIDVSNLSSGIYFLNIEDDNGNLTVKKFIKK